MTSFAYTRDAKSPQSLVQSAQRFLLECYHRYGSTETTTTVFFVYDKDKELIQINCASWPFHTILLSSFFLGCCLSCCTR